jgi:hypothetical protein
MEFCEGGHLLGQINKLSPMGFFSEEQMIEALVS